MYLQRIYRQWVWFRIYISYFSKTSKTENLIEKKKEKYLNGHFNRVNASRQWKYVDLLTLFSNQRNAGWKKQWNTTTHTHTHCNLATQKQEWGSGLRTGKAQSVNKEREGQVSSSIPHSQQPLQRYLSAYSFKIWELYFAMRDSSEALTG